MVLIAAVAVMAGCGRTGPDAPDPAGGTTAATPEQLERSLRVALADADPRLVVCVDPATAGDAFWECRVTTAAASHGGASAVYRIRFRTERCWRNVSGTVKGCVAD